MEELKPGKTRRIEALFEVLLAGFGGWAVTFLFLGILGPDNSEMIARPTWLALFLVMEATITLVIVCLLEGWTDSRSSPGVFSLIRWEPRALLSAAALVPLLFVSVLFSGWIFHVFFPQYTSLENPLLEKIRTPLDLGAFMFAGVYAGGVKEEVQRAFILLRFERGLGGIYTGLILWSAVFGLGHYEQGWNSVFSASVLGLIFGWLFIRKRNLFTVITVHALYDVAVLAVYWIYLRDFPG